MKPLPTPPLPCPACRVRGHVGGTRIGNHRTECNICNVFAQNVMRLARRRLKEAHPEEYESLRLKIEIDLYPQVIEDWGAAQDERIRKAAIAEGPEAGVTPPRCVEFEK